MLPSWSVRRTSAPTAESRPEERDAMAGCHEALEHVPSRTLCKPISTTPVPRPLYRHLLLQALNAGRIASTCARDKPHRIAVFSQRPFTVPKTSAASFSASDVPIPKREPCAPQPVTVKLERVRLRAPHHVNVERPHQRRLVCAEAVVCEDVLATSAHYSPLLGARRLVMRSRSCSWRPSSSSLATSSRSESRPFRACNTAA